MEDLSLTAANVKCATTFTLAQASDFFLRNNSFTSIPQCILDSINVGPSVLLELESSHTSFCSSASACGCCQLAPLAHWLRTNEIPLATRSITCGKNKKTYRLGKFPGTTTYANICPAIKPPPSTVKTTRTTPPTTTVRASAPPEFHCDAPFVQYYDGCYWFSKSNHTLNWEMANNYCRHMNSSLVIIRNDGDNTFVRDNIAAERSAWIGYRRADYISPQSFLASNGSSVSTFSYNNFDNVYQPGPAYCFAISSSNSSNRWLAFRCAEERAFACSYFGDHSIYRPVIADMTNLQLDPFSEYCDTDWMHSGISGFCYKVKTEPLTHGMAKEACENEAHDSNLLYIDSWSEFQLVQGIMMGLAGQAWQNAYWTAMKVLSPSDWYWHYRDTDKSTIPVAFSNWASGTPKPESLDGTWGTKYDCLIVKPTSPGVNGWENANCNAVLRPSICKRPSKIVTAPTTITNVHPQLKDLPLGCPSDWTESDGYCYQANAPSTGLDWKQQCQLSRTQPARVLSLQQLKDLALDSWIDLDCTAKPFNPREYVQQNGQRVEFTPWVRQIPYPDQPWQMNMSCVATVGSQGVAAYDCNEMKTSTCMTPIIPKVQLPGSYAANNGEDGCHRWGRSWDRQQPTCFYPGHDPIMPLAARPFLTFEEARSFCQAKYQGDLATFESVEKQNFLAEFLLELETAPIDFWIGMTVNGTHTLWITGAEVDVATYSWAVNEPKLPVMARTTFCAAVYSARKDGSQPGRWYLSSCGEKKFALCEGFKVGHSPAPTVLTTTQTTEGTDKLTATHLTTILTTPQHSDLPSTEPDVNNSNIDPALSDTETAIAASSGAFLLICVVFCWHFLRLRRLRKQKRTQLHASHNDPQNWFCSAMGHGKLAPSLGIGYADCEYACLLQVPATAIELSNRVLGRGQFGIVYKATAFHLPTLSKSPVAVAVKTLHKAATKEAAEMFDDEFKVMLKCGRHVNIVNILGVIHEGWPFLILEYCEFGSLLVYLRNRQGEHFYSTTNADGKMSEVNYNDIRALWLDICWREDRTDTVEEMQNTILSTHDLIKFSHQICRGMEYLSARRIIHRDLAARNVLVAASRVIKISDFGLARHGMESYTVANNLIPLPILWMPPDTILERQFSQKSDVWSYGVLLWEIFSLGGTPFEDGDVAKFSANVFAEWLMQGHQMSRPVEAPLEMYDLMRNCWHILSDDRPTFSAILKILDGFILHVFADTPYLSVENLDTIPDSFTEQMTRFAECQQAVALGELATLN
ncbi:Macrophage colony-stimulating factor 1 receptor 2 [Hypsibius exemplaris]|uniref:Macrophage colony-stimulating factor 1 receptor 2 n=1 Tax=Hypsibius exemplaris TaxID=2072580 RepID=A0A1W0WKM7_HYPEX|nr:Macrophage colony-stimulating factor 1 receptor 2 [Hypsibius exemplaris]